MVKWLRSLLGFGQREREEPTTQPVAHEPAEDFPPVVDDQLNASDRATYSGAGCGARQGHYNTTASELQSAPQQQAADEQDVEALVMRLAHDSRTENRKSAAEALRQLGPAATAAIPALLEVVTQADLEVRQAALKALIAINADWWKLEAVQEAIPFWGKALKRGDLTVNNGLEQLLVRIGPPAVSGLALALSGAENEVGNIFVLRALGRMGPCAAGAVPEATRLLGSENPQVCIAAANTLANIGPSAVTAIPSLTAGLTHWHSDVRQAIAFCLASFGPAAEPAAPALLQLLIDREAGVRKAAAKALERIGPKMVPSLVEIIQLRDMLSLRQWFKWQMQALAWYASFMRDDIRRDPERALGSLTWMSYEAEEEWETIQSAHIAALQLLGRFGPAASDAVPAIAQVLTDSNPRLRSAAAAALGHIGPQARRILPELTKLLRRQHCSKTMRMVVLKSAATLRPI